MPFDDGDDAQNIIFISEKNDIAAIGEAPDTGADIIAGPPEGTRQFGQPPALPLEALNKAQCWLTVSRPFRQIGQNIGEVACGGLGIG